MLDLKRKDNREKVFSILADWKRVVELILHGAVLVLRVAILHLLIILSVLYDPAQTVASPYTVSDHSAPAVVFSLPKVSDCFYLSIYHIYYLLSL